MSTYRDYTPKDDAPLLDGDESFIGVNMRLDPDKVPPGFLAYGSQNLRFRNGTAATRRGISKPGWLNVTDPVNAPGVVSPVGKFYGAGVFKDPASIQYVITAADGAAYRHVPGNCRVKLTLPAGVQILSRCSFTQAFNKIWCFRGRYLAPLVCSDLDAGFTDLLPQYSASAVYNAAITALTQLPDEIAYGPYQAVTSVTYTPTMTTVVTAQPHGYVTGADVTFTGATPGDLNGRKNIVVVDALTFTTARNASGSGTATGTIKVSNNSFYWQALGSTATNGALTYSTGTATVTTTAAHGFQTNQYVTISGVTPVTYNGTYQITVTDSTHFTYALGADPGGSATVKGQSQTSVVIAGQTPAAHPEAWQQVFNILPNADDAVYTGNQLLVPTAYTPGATAYDKTSVYTKKDYLVKTDIQDDIHFDFVNAEFRINEGGDDEIMALEVIGPGTVIVFKAKTWGVLTGLIGDPSGVTLQMSKSTWGACSLRGTTQAGNDALCVSTQRGISSLNQNQYGQVRGTDTAFSNEMQKIVDRINWTYAAGIRMAWWNDCLYCAVPLDDARTKTPGPNLIPAGAQYVPGGFLEDGYAYSLPVMSGQTYNIAQGPNNPGGLSNDLAIINPGFPLPQPLDTPFNQNLVFGEVTALGPLLTLQANNFYVPGVSSNVTASVIPTYAGCNNALLVYDYRMGASGSPLTADFRAGQWCPPDIGPFPVLEFFKCTVFGKEQLCFIGADGFVSMFDECQAWDEVGDPNSPSGISRQPIEAISVSRGYRPSDPKAFDAQQKFRRVQIVAGTWNPELTITANTGAAFSEQILVDAVTFDRTKYFKPFHKQAWDATNVNRDFQTPGRFDYSVAPTNADGIYMDSGVVLDQFQETTKRVNLRPLAGRFAQFTITCSQGMMQLKSIGPESAEGPRREGVLI